MHFTMKLFNLSSNLLALIMGLELLLLCIEVRCAEQTMPKPSLTTMVENRNRENLGVRTIKAEWYLYRIQFGHEDWKLSSHDRWLAKRVQRDSKEKLLWEEDYYHSGKTFKTANNGTGWESITIHYDYRSQTLEVHYIGKNPALIKAFEMLKGKASTQTEKLSVVDTTLKEWGLSRLDADKKLEH